VIQTASVVQALVQANVISTSAIIAMPMPVNLRVAVVMHS